MTATIETQLSFEGTDFSDIIPKIKELDDKEAELDSKRELVLCDIMYTDQYKQLMGIFNALLNLNEYSERSLIIANMVIDAIPAYYTAWCYKLDIVRKLKKDINEELLWLDEFTLENPKNYQIWSYRIELLKENAKNEGGANEKTVLKKENVILKLMLEEDSKNHHVWGYKSWLMNFLKLDLEDLNLELAYSDFLITEDVLNNSAWCFRYNIVMKLVNIGPQQELYLAELCYAKEKITLYPDNVSSWNYYYRIIEILSEIEETKVINQHLTEDMVSLCETYFNTTSFAIEYYCKLLVLVKGDESKLKDMYTLLRDHRDPIRKIFWDYKLSQL